MASEGISYDKAELRAIARSFKAMDDEALAQAKEKSAQGDWYEQVNRREAIQIGQFKVADEKSCNGSGQHERDPGVAGCAVQADTLVTAFTGPECDGADGCSGQGCAHMNGDQGGHLQFWLLVLFRCVLASASILHIVNFFTA
jgi:hypothetical protein